MRRSFGLILLLALLGAGLLAGGSFAVQRQGDQVVVTAETLAGAPSAAKGLTVNLPLVRGNCLHWDISFPEDYEVSLTIAKDDTGDISSLTVSSDPRYQYQAEGWSADTPQGLLFTFCNYYEDFENTQQVRLMDGSSIPGGWGIYRLTVDEARGGAVWRPCILCRRAARYWTFGASMTAPPSSC